MIAWYSLTSSKSFCWARFVALIFTIQFSYESSLINSGSIPENIKKKLTRKNRKLIVADYCMACGKCIEICKQKGISLINDQAVPNDKCILCGYCARVCPEFCIKVI